MHKKTIITLAAIAWSFSAVAQKQDSIRISGKLLNNTEVTGVSFAGFNGADYTAQVPVVNNGFQLSVPKTLPQGVYRLVYEPGQQRTTALIIGWEPEISFQLDAGPVDALPDFSASTQNKNWYDYLKKEQKIFKRIDPLNVFIVNYPDVEDPLVKASEKQLKKMQVELQKEFKDFVSQHANTLEGKLVANRPYWFPTDLREDRTKQAQRYMDQYWSAISLRDTALIHTPIYNELIIGYIGRYLNPGTPGTNAEKQAGLISSVDSVMYRFGGNARTKTMAIDFISQIAKQTGQDALLQYVDQHYVNEDQCSNDQQKADYERRMAGYEAMKPGQPAPEIPFLDAAGQPKTLHQIAGEKVVVAFWAGWCPHCTKAMPQLNTEMAKHPDVTVLAVSLDDNPEVYKKASADLKNMIHLCDFKRWESIPVSAYHVSATPTFFLLDKDRKIVGKYTSVDALMKAM